jgi:hypothetical protein
MIINAVVVQTLTENLVLTKEPMYTLGVPCSYKGGVVLPGRTCTLLLVTGLSALCCPHAGASIVLGDGVGTRPETSLLSTPTGHGAFAPLRPLSPVAVDWETTTQSGVTEKYVGDI